MAWFRKAAEQGHGFAQYFLGSMYSMGHGGIQDDKLAYAWLSVAAANTNHPFDAIQERDKVALRLTAALDEATSLANQYVEKYQSKR
ncbi:Sel1 repeat protein [compost metagenome]